MKLSIPKTPAEYFQKTEHAVRSAYGGLHSCWTYYQQGLQHTTVFEPPKTREDQARLDRGLELVRKYFDVKIFEAMFSGLILRTAYMAIRLYSRNKTIPPSCAMLVKPSQKSAIPFCIGKERHGIPAGLIIFAGRNNTITGTKIGLTRPRGRYSTPSRVRSGTSPHLILRSTLATRQSPSTPTKSLSRPSAGIHTKSI